MTATDRKLEQQLETIRKRIEEREASAVYQLPLWPESKRGTPNTFLRSALFSAIQSKDRVYMKRATLFSQNGYTVQYTGQQLNQEDLSLWETLVHLAKDHPLGDRCTFTAHGILKALGLHTGGDEHERLHMGVIRLTACAVEISFEGKRYFGPLIKSGIKDDITAHYSIELNRELIRLYGENEWTAIDWEQRRRLGRKPLAQHLHAYYSSHRQPFPVTLEFLQKLTGSRSTQKADFKRKVKAALTQLVAVGFLQSFKIEGDRVTAYRVAPIKPPRG